MSHNFHTYTFDQHQSPNLTIPEIAISGSANASDTLFSDTSIASSPILQYCNGDQQALYAIHKFNFISTFMYTMCILWETHVPRKNAMETL